MIALWFSIQEGTGLTQHEANLNLGNMRYEYESVTARSFTPVLDPELARGRQDIFL